MSLLRSYVESLRKRVLGPITIGDGIRPFVVPTNPDERELVPTGC